MLKEENQKRVKGWSNNGAKWKGKSDFDTDYVGIEIRDRVVKTGEGENDFIIEKYVVETRTPIDEVIEADASSVGVYNIIKNIMKTGDMSLLPVDDGSCDVDMVGAPETLMELKQLGVDAEKKFAQLPPEITESRDMVNFIENMSQEKFDSLMQAIAKRAQPAQKEEENK